VRPLSREPLRRGARRRASRFPGALLPCAGALAAAAGLALATPALGALEPESPANGEAVGQQPTFRWVAGAASRYEVYAELPSGPLKVADAPSTSLSATSTVALPDDTRLRWFVRAIGSGGATAGETAPAARWTIQVATTPGAPTITGAPPAIARNPSPTFTWAGTRVSSRWSILSPAGTAVQSGEVPTAGGQVVPAALPDGSYQFRVAQRNLVGVEGPPASYGFSIDTVAPGPLALRRSTSQRDSRNTPRYSWTGLEPGAVVTWRVLRASGVVAQGPANVAAGDVTPARLRSGSYVFEARQTDLAGNSGPPTTDAFVVLPRLAPGIRLPMRNVRRLSPSVGATVLGVRPTLRWRSGPRARTYNVQVFQVVDGAKLRKVVSAFPHRRRFVVPRKKALDRGSCYVWRVWPFRGERPLKEPVGVSHFCVRPT
jgi:hypothetical protein